MAVLSVLTFALALSGSAVAGPIKRGLIPTGSAGGFPDLGGDDDGSVIPTDILGGGDLPIPTDILGGGDLPIPTDILGGGDLPIPTPGSGFSLPGFGDDKGSTGPTPTGSKGGFWENFPGFGSGSKPTGGFFGAERPTGTPSAFPGFSGGDRPTGFPSFGGEKPTGALGGELPTGTPGAFKGLLGRHEKHSGIFGGERPTGTPGAFPDFGGEKPSGIFGGERPTGTPGAFPGFDGEKPTGVFGGERPTGTPGAFPGFDGEKPSGIFGGQRPTGTQSGFPGGFPTDVPPVATPNSFLGDIFGNDKDGDDSNSGSFLDSLFGNRGGDKSSGNKESAIVPTGTRGSGGFPGFGNGNGNGSGQQTPVPFPTGGFGGFPGGDDDSNPIPTGIPGDDEPVPTVTAPLVPSKPTATNGQGDGGDSGAIPTYSAVPGSPVGKRAQHLRV